MSSDQPEEQGTQPPFEAWYVVEVDVEFDRDKPLFVRVRGPFGSEEKAKRERDNQQEAWDNALEEWDGENPYDFKGWQIVEKKVWDHQLQNLERQDEESHRIAMEAAGAVGASLLAEDGIGPLAGDDSE